MPHGFPMLEAQKSSSFYSNANTKNRYFLGSKIFCTNAEVMSPQQRRTFSGPYHFVFAKAFMYLTPQQIIGRFPPHRTYFSQPNSYKSKNFNDPRLQHFLG